MKQKLIAVAECLYRSHESKIYYARVRRDGKLITSSLKTTSRETANWKLGQFLEDSSKLKPNLSRATFAEVVEVFRKTGLAARQLKPTSREDIEYRLKALFREWPGAALDRTPLRSITVGDCERWFGHRQQCVGPQRLKNERNLLRDIFRFAIREGYTLRNPADHLPKVRVPRSQVVPPTKAEFNRLIGEMRRRKNFDAEEFVELLAYSGLRLSEAASLRWCHVDFERGRFRVAGKGRAVEEYDEVPLFPSLRDLLLRIRERRGTVLPAQRILNIRQCRDGLAGAAHAVGLPRVTHHSLRHFFCSNALETGADFKAIAGWLRHKDGGILVAKTYGHLRADHSDELARKMVFAAKQV